ncbi:MAG: stress-induced protein, partial [Proteobacteria bacterium]
MATQRGNQGDSKSGGAKKNPGNFANDPERARKAGSKGGQSRGTGNGSRSASTRDGDSVKA